MLEVQLQKLIIDAMQEGGAGDGVKIANRFSVGYSDLLIKQANVPAFLMEVKQVEYADPRVPRKFKLDLTTPQKAFLRRFHRVGMFTCVGSFVQGRNISELRFAVLPLAFCERHDWIATTSMHEPLGGSRYRYANIRRLIYAAQTRSEGL